jgi:hypothetical protein
MRWSWIVVGVVVVAIGVVWTLQGIGLIRGSVMSGQTAFVIIGAVVALAGLVVVGLGTRRRAPTT